MDKWQILDTYIESQKQKLEDMKVSLDRIHQGISQAPGPSQSHSDTTRFQESGVALELDERIRGLQEKILLLERLRTDLRPNESVFVGALLGLRDVVTGEINTYFLVEKGEGDFLEIDDREIIFVSAAAPIVQAAIGKKKGDFMNFRGKTFKIAEVQ